MSYDSIERSDFSHSKIELFLFEMEGNPTKYAYTNSPRAISVAGHTFIPKLISRSAQRTSGGDNEQERMTIKLPFDDPVAILHVPYLPPRPVKVTIMSYHRRDALTEVVRGFVGSVTNFAQRGEEAELACSQIIDSMQQTVPWAPHKRNCIWATYSEGCGLDRMDWMTTVTVQSSAATTVQSPQIGARPDGWFTAGYAENPANGEVRFITQHIGDTVKLVYPFTNLAPGTDLMFFAGDDHTPQTCRDKFNNKLNYLGFDHFPTYNPFVEGTYGGGRGGGGGSRFNNYGGGSTVGDIIREVQSRAPAAPYEPPYKPFDDQDI